MKQKLITNTKEKFNKLKDGLNSHLIHYTDKDLFIFNKKHDFNSYNLINEYIKNNLKKCFYWRGNNSESLLHWAVLNNLEATKNLINYVKLDVNLTDKNNKTPFDYLLDRYLYHVLLNIGDLNQNARVFITNQTNTHAIYLYSIGAKTQHDVVDFFSKSGSYQFLDYLYNEKGYEALIDIGEEKKTILHNWILLPECIEKHQKLIEILENYHFVIDVEDKEKRTPLFYAIDGMICKPELAESFFIPVIKSLLRQQANPFHNSLVINDKYKSNHNLSIQELEELKQNNRKEFEDYYNPYLNSYNLFDLNIEKEKELFLQYDNLIKEYEKYHSSPYEKEKILNKEYDFYFKNENRD